MTFGLAWISRRARGELGGVGSDETVGGVVRDLHFFCYLDTIETYFCLVLPAHEGCFLFFQCHSLASFDMSGMVALPDIEKDVS